MENHFGKYMSIFFIATSSTKSPSPDINIIFLLNTKAVHVLSLGPIVRRNIDDNSHMSFYNNNIERISNHSCGSQSDIVHHRFKIYT